MIHVRPARPEDFLAIELRPEQAAVCSPQLLKRSAESAHLLGDAMTAVRLSAESEQPGDIPLIIAGVQTRWAGSGVAWAFVSGLATRREMWSITEGVATYLAHLSPLYHRIEAWTHTQPEAWGRVAGRWLARFGFEPEGVARRFDAAGRDMMIWARIHDDG